MGPQDPKDVTRDIARDLTGLAGELAALEANARHWLTDPGYMQTYIYAWKTPTRRSRRRSWRPGLLEDEGADAQEGASTRETLIGAMGDALSAITARAASGFFGHCGYRALAQLL